MSNEKRIKAGKGRILKVTPAGENHQVVTVESKRAESDFMKSPCKDCPWKKSSAGIFPPEAFVASASTAYDMASNTFACHCAGLDTPRTCAGFLLVSSDHNLAVRLQRFNGETFEGLSDGGHELFSSYKDMAVANGVAEDHPALASCRDCN